MFRWVSCFLRHAEKRGSCLDEAEDEGGHKAKFMAHRCATMETRNLTHLINAENEKAAMEKKRKRNIDTEDDVSMKRACYGTAISGTTTELETIPGLDYTQPSMVFQPVPHTTEPITIDTAEGVYLGDDAPILYQISAPQAWAVS
jgi:hypothetical protein